MAEERHKPVAGPQKRKPSWRDPVSIAAILGIVAIIPFYWLTRHYFPALEELGQILFICWLVVMLVLSTMRARKRL